MHQQPKKAVSVLLPVELYLTLRQLAHGDGRTLSAEIRQILKGYTEYIARGGISWCCGCGNRGMEKYRAEANTPRSKCR